MTWFCFYHFTFKLLMCFSCWFVRMQRFLKQMKFSLFFCIVFVEQYFHFGILKSEKYAIVIEYIIAHFPFNRDCITLYNWRIEEQNTKQKFKGYIKVFCYQNQTPYVALFMNSNLTGTTTTTISYYLLHTLSCWLWNFE